MNGYPPEAACNAALRKQKIPAEAGIFCLNMLPYIISFLAISHHA